MPITLTCTGCRQTFQLKDEMAGRKVRCPECESVQVVPQLEAEESLFTLDTEDGDAGGLHPSFNRDRFLFRQKLMTLSEKYVVWDDEERPILFIERPAHVWRQVLAVLATIGIFIVTFASTMALILNLSGNKPVNGLVAVLMVISLILCFILPIIVYVAVSAKRHISFYADESKDELLLQVLQDRKLQVLFATYTVLDSQGNRLGWMKKNYLYNLFRKRWDVRDAEGRLLLIAREDSVLLSLMRRLLGPMFGFLRTNFILIVPEADGIEVTRGEFNRNFTIFDRYVLDLTRDRPRRIDRRLAVALGVLLDTGEHR